MWEQIERRNLFMDDNGWREKVELQMLEKSGKETYNKILWNIRKYCDWWEYKEELWQGFC